MVPHLNIFIDRRWFHI